MRLLPFTILAIAAFAVVIGCTTNPQTGKVEVDPAAIGDVVGELADVAEVEVRAWIPLKDQKPYLERIEAARKVGNLPALRQLVADLKAVRGIILRPSTRASVN